MDQSVILNVKNALKLFATKDDESISAGINLLIQHINPSVLCANTQESAKLRLMILSSISLEWLIRIIRGSYPIHVVSSCLNILNVLVSDVSFITQLKAHAEDITLFFGALSRRSLDDILLIAQSLCLLCTRLSQLNSLFDFSELFVTISSLSSMIQTLTTSISTKASEIMPLLLDVFDSYNILFVAIQNKVENSIFVKDSSAPLKKIIVFLTSETLSNTVDVYCSKEAPADICVASGMILSNWMTLYQTIVTIDATLRFKSNPAWVDVLRNTVVKDMIMSEDEESGRSKSHQIVSIFLLGVLLRSFSLSFFAEPDNKPKEYCLSKGETIGATICSRFLSTEMKLMLEFIEYHLVASTETAIPMNEESFSRLQPKQNVSPSTPASHSRDVTDSSSDLKERLLQKSRHSRMERYIEKEEEVVNSLTACAFAVDALVECLGTVTSSSGAVVDRSQSKPTSEVTDSASVTPPQSMESPELVRDLAASLKEAERVLVGALADTWQSDVRFPLISYFSRNPQVFSDAIDLGSRVRRWLDDPMNRSQCTDSGATAPTSSAADSTSPDLVQESIGNWRNSNVKADETSGMLRAELLMRTLPAAAYALFSLLEEDSFHGGGSTSRLTLNSMKSNSTVSVGHEDEGEKVYSDLPAALPLLQLLLRELAAPPPQGSHFPCTSLFPSSRSACQRLRSKTGGSSLVLQPFPRALPLFAAWVGSMKEKHADLEMQEQVGCDILLRTIAQAASASREVSLALLDLNVRLREAGSSGSRAITPRLLIHLLGKERLEDLFAGTSYFVQDFMSQCVSAVSFDIAVDKRAAELGTIMAEKGISFVSAAKDLASGAKRLLSFVSTMVGFGRAGHEPLLAISRSYAEGSQTSTQDSCNRPLQDHYLPPLSRISGELLHLVQYMFVAAAVLLRSGFVVNENSLETSVKNTVIAISDSIMESSQQVFGYLISLPLDEPLQDDSRLLFDILCASLQEFSFK